jgi:hypothetical protein
MRADGQELDLRPTVPGERAGDREASNPLLVKGLICHRGITTKNGNIFGEDMAMSARIKNFDRNTNSAERTGVTNMCKVNARFGFALVLFVFSVASMVPPFAAAQTAPAAPGDAGDAPYAIGDRPERVEAGFIKIGFSFGSRVNISAGRQQNQIAPARGASVHRLDINSLAVAL